MFDTNPGLRHALRLGKGRAGMAFFQIVMLVYNLWRHLQAFADAAEEKAALRRYTVHVVRLKLLFIAAKIVRHSDKVKINYSSYLEARPRLEKTFKKLDALRLNPEIWERPITWPGT
jgi:hypothetical protein